MRTWDMGHVPCPHAPMPHVPMPRAMRHAGMPQRTTHNAHAHYVVPHPGPEPTAQGHCYYYPETSGHGDMAHGDMGTWDMGTWGHVTWGHGTWDMDVAVYGIRVHRRAALTHEAQHHLTPLRAALSRVEFWNPGIQGPGSMAGSRDQPPAACDPHPPCHYQIIRLGGRAGHLRSSKRGPL